MDTICMNMTYHIYCGTNLKIFNHEIVNEINKRSLLSTLKKLNHFHQEIGLKMLFNASYDEFHQ